MLNWRLPGCKDGPRVLNKQVYLHGNAILWISAPCVNVYMYQMIGGLNTVGRCKWPYYFYGNVLLIIS